MIANCGGRTGVRPLFLPETKISCKILTARAVWIDKKRFQNTQQGGIQVKDRDLTRLLQKDPDEGLRAAMQVYLPLVKAVLLRILPRDPRDVEECMADTFVSLWHHAAELERQDTPLRPWLIVTARNKGIDRYHTLCRHTALSLDEELGQTIGEVAEFDRATSDAADWVGALVAAMDPPDREIFLRKYYLLQSSKEIAAALEMTEGTVNTRLSRGRERLRRQLQQKGVHCHA